MACWNTTEPFSETTKPTFFCEANTIENAGVEKLRVVHANVQSLKNKVGELEAFLINKDADFVCITEHWLAEEQIKTMQIQGFSLASFSARTKLNGRGSAIYIKNCFDFDVLYVDQDFNIEKRIECCCISLRDFNINILAIYRCGLYDTFLDSIEGILNQVQSNKQ